MGFPVMTERTRLISYLLYGLFSAILKNNTKKTKKKIRDVIFNISLRALWLSSSLKLKKYLYASIFLSVIEKIVIFVGICCCFRPRVRSFYSQLKRAVEQRKFFIMPSHYKKILPAQLPIRAHVLL